MSTSLCEKADSAAYQPFGTSRGTIAPKFEGAVPKAAGLAAAFARVADEEGCGFFDAGTVTASSRVDGVHLDAEQHAALGAALAADVGPRLAAG